MNHKDIQILTASPEDISIKVAELLDHRLKTLEEKLDQKPEKYLSIKELALMLKVDRSTIHHWAKKGVLKKHGLGKRVYFKLSEVEEAMICLS
jgi:excisionase family DNA binding protein